MKIKINDYYEPDHFRTISEDNYNISRTCEREKNEMHHIHNTSEALLVEDGAADYYISGRKYHVESYDILVVDAMEHYLRRIDRLPFLRYGFTAEPIYYKSIILDHDLQKVFGTPPPDVFVQNYKNVDQAVFGRLIGMLCYLKEKGEVHKPSRTQIQRTIITQTAVLLFRVFRFERSEPDVSPSNARMLEIKEYIDVHFNEELSLNMLSEKFFLHPTTISKDFTKYCGYNLNKYTDTVRACGAASLLENSSDSVAVIVERRGYDSVNTFLRQFKSITDVSPLQYRKSAHEWRETNRRCRRKQLVIFVYQLLFLYRFLSQDKKMVIFD